MPKSDKNGPLSNAKISETRLQLSCALSRTHELGVRLQFVSAHVSSIASARISLFAAATETLVGEPALATFFSA